MLYAIQNLQIVGFAKEARGIQSQWGAYRSRGPRGRRFTTPLDAHVGQHWHSQCIVTDRINGRRSG